MVHQFIFRLRCEITSKLHISRDGLVVWLPRSPELIPLDFFFWGHLKPLVYESPVATVENRTARVALADISSTLDWVERVRQSSVHQCRLCYDLSGSNFE
ncbi:uncharacterized protein TNCV_2418461 [Trichonephila clavipes]|nr:uncharacterized protein TNCV_2418461 [Trichonephila clavipes]